MENQKYFQSTGRRKTAVANVKIFLDDGGKILINGKELKEYFSSSFFTKYSFVSIRNC
jgi:ribosomal protein S9